MSDKTKIEWTDATWNIVTGCSVVSPGCEHCYAMKLAGTRLKHDPSRAGLTVTTAAGPVWNGEVRFNAKWLDQPLRWQRARRIFVCAHGDLFHESVPDAWLDQVFAVMALAPQHTFQVLTKRADRMFRYLSDDSQARRDGRGTAVLSLNPNQPLESLPWPLPNVWLGVSVENQAAADERVPLLLQAPATVRWISAEPLLGPVFLNRIIIAAKGWQDVLSGWRDCKDYPGRENTIDWVVVGGESGKGARPMHPEWARSLRDQCAAAGVPLLCKQWGAWAPSDNWLDDQVIPSGTLHYLDSTNDDRNAMWLVGKKAAGRHLDGQLHDGYPA